jgi:hypothetical protein
MQASIQRLSLVLLAGCVLLVASTSGQQQRVQQKTSVAQQKAKTATVQQKQAGGAAPATALEVVPQGVLGFAVLRNLGELDEKLNALAKGLQIPAPPALMTVRQLLGVGEGLNEKGAVVLAVLPPPEEGSPPLPVMFVPVTDYGKFIAALQPADAKAEQTEVTIAGRPHSVMRKGNYAVLSATHGGAPVRLKEIAAAKAGALSLPRGLTAWAADHDGFLVVMPETIKMALGPIRQGLQQAKGAFPADNDQLKGVAAMFDVYDKMLSTVEKEVTHFAVGLRIDQGNVFLNSHSVFLPNGSLAQAAKDAQAPAESALASLPAGPYMMAFDGVFPETWFQGMAKFSAEAMRMMTPPGGEKLSDEDVKKFVDVMQKSMSGIKSMAFRMGPMRPGKSIYESTAGVMKVANAKEFVNSYEKTVGEMQSLFKKANNPAVGSYEISKTEIGGQQVLQVTMDMSAMLGQVPDQNAQQMMKLMVGESGKVTAYFTPADATTVVMAYGKEALADTLAAAKKNGQTFAAQPEVAKTIKQLPAQSQWVLLFSPSGIVEFVSTVVQHIAPGGPGQLPPFPATPPVGFGARMSAEGCDTSLVLPNEVLAAIGGYAQALQQKLGQ